MNKIESLINLGLSKKEAKIYLALFTLKKASVWHISKKAKIKRPTAYQVLESLESKGLISSTLYRGVKDYKILSIGSLKKYVRKQRILMQKSIGQMQKEYNKRKFKLRLRVYNNISSLKTLLEKALHEKCPLYILGDEHEFQNYLGGYWDYFCKRSRQVGITTKFKSSGQAVTLMLWSDKIVFVKLAPDFQLFGLKNKELAELYQFIWKNY